MRIKKDFSREEKERAINSVRAFFTFEDEGVFDEIKEKTTGDEYLTKHVLKRLEYTKEIEYDEDKEVYYKGENFDNTSINKI